MLVYSMPKKGSKKAKESIDSSASTTGAVSSTAISSSSTTASTKTTTVSSTTTTTTTTTTTSHTLKSWTETLKQHLKPIFVDANGKPLLISLLGSSKWCSSNLLIKNNNT